MRIAIQPSLKTERLSICLRSENTSMSAIENGNTVAKGPGLFLHKAVAYDLGARLMTFGRERALRQAILDRARLQPGESVLDVGCGTGSLALEAKRRVGPTGTVRGIDGSPQMIARAAQKARKTGLEIEFANALAQALPFADSRFDVAFSTLMFHHLPRSSREQCAREMRRVVRPGGRVMVVDFARSTRRKPAGLLGHLHRRGGVDPNEIVAHLEGAGLGIVECGDIGFMDLRFALAAVPGTA